MKASSRAVVVLVTVPDRKAARLMARALVEAQLAACVSIVPQLESHYRWEGKIESARELLLLIKSQRSRLTELERQIRLLHPYEVPEIITLSIASGFSRYLGWIEENTEKPRAKRSSSPA